MFTCKLRISRVFRIYIRCERKERSMYVNNTLSEAKVCRRDYRRMYFSIGVAHSWA